jgi:hypothetical protein
VNESAMTVKDWEWLALVAERETRACKRSGAHASSESWNTIADKCRTRADALREGRVMP